MFDAFLTSFQSFSEMPIVSASRCLLFCCNTFIHCSFYAQIYHYHFNFMIFFLREKREGHFHACHVFQDVLQEFL